MDGRVIDLQFRAAGAVAGTGPGPRLGLGPTVGFGFWILVLWLENCLPSSILTKVLGHDHFSNGDSNEFLFSTYFFLYWTRLDSPLSIFNVLRLWEKKLWNPHRRRSYFFLPFFLLSFIFLYFLVQFHLVHFLMHFFVVL